MAELTNSRESIAQAKRLTTDFTSMSTRQRIKHLELEGFTMLPGSLDAGQIARITEETNKLDLKATSYSEHQRVFGKVNRTNSPFTNSMVDYQPTVSFLKELFGDELVCTSNTFALSAPGHPGIAIHADSMPYGSAIFGNASSAPILIRVLYYLDDLTPERSPLKVIPGSHLSVHRQASSYNRFLRHPDEVMVNCQAGDAAIINQRVFHGNFPNFSDCQRRLLAISYRPAWAGPVFEVEEEPEEALAALAPNVRPYFENQNRREITYDAPDRYEGMPVDGVGVSYRRWQDSGPRA